MSTSHPELYRYRAGEGLERDVANAILDALTNDKPVGSAVVEALTQNAINRYSDKISAMLRRGGIDIANDEPLDAAKLIEVLSGALGYSLGDLSESGLVGAVDTEAARRVSEYLGFNISTLIDAGALAADIKAEIVERVTNGGAGGLVAAKLLKRLKDSATWARAGYDADSRRKVLLSVAQRKYRQSNRMVWD